MQADGEQGVFCEADQLLQTDADNVHAQLAELLNGSFAMLCDVKAAGADQYYRLSNEKARSCTLQMLCTKRHLPEEVLSISRKRYCHALMALLHACFEERCKFWVASGGVGLRRC